MNRIPVGYEHLGIGTITVAENDPSFADDPRWLNRRGAFPVSLGMPLGSNAFSPEILMPWLANLLPEGATLPIVGRDLGVSPRDIIGLLKWIGRGTAGALSFGGPPAGETPDDRPVPDESGLERILEELPAKPYLAGADGVSMSLTGAQKNLPVTLLLDRRMADQCGFNRTLILRQVEAVAGRVMRELPEAVAVVKAMPAGDHPLLGEFAAAIAARCRAVVTKLAPVESNVPDEPSSEAEATP